MSEEVLQIPEDRREAKGKGEMERYTDLNEEFRKGEIKKPSSVISTKKEENNRMGKTRDLFKKIRDTKGTFQAKMGSIKDRNGMEQQKQKIRRGGQNTQKSYTKMIIMTQITTMV